MAKRIEERVSDLKNAILRLKESISDSKIIDNSTMRDGVVQRFEFVIELSWKTMKQILLNEGIIEATTPKSAVREGFKAGLITHPDIWIEMLDSRNLTVHTYDEATAIDIYNKICEGYYMELRKFLSKVEETL